MKQTYKQKTFWFIMALIAVVMIAPNNSFLKNVVADMGPLWVSFLRFSTLAIVLLPALYLGRKQINEKNFKYSVIAGIAYASAIMAVASSIYYSQASYPALIGISSPIIMMIYSVILTKERISPKTYFGISLAAFGGFIIIFLPILLKGSMNGTVSPIATIMAIINAVASPLMFVMAKRAVDHQLNIMTSLSIVAWVGVVLTGGVILMTGAPAPTSTSLVQFNVIAPILYAVVGVMFLTRAMTTMALKHLGSAQVAGLDYLGVFLSVLVPVVALGESLSAEMIIGGVLILAGVIAIQTRFTPIWWKRRQMVSLGKPIHSTIE